MRYLFNIYKAGLRGNMAISKNNNLIEITLA